MADGNGPGRVTIAGAAFAVLMMVLIIISVWLFIARPWWFPDLASVSGADIDGVFTAVLIVTGIAFIGVQGVLGYFVARYGTRGTERAGYWHDNPKAEAGLLIGTAVIMTVLVFMGQKVWASIYFTDAPPGSLEVQATAEQEPFSDEQLAEMTAFARRGCTRGEETRQPHLRAGGDDPHCVPHSRLLPHGHCPVGARRVVIARW